MDRSRPLVSVLMNCHNCSDFLQEAIDSVYFQTYENWEIIFVDNASNDKSREIAQSYDKKLKYFYIDKKIPLGNARNKALTKAKGEYLAFLDCDDVFLPGKLRKQVYEMQSGNFGMCYGSAYHINKNGDVIGKRKALNKKGELFRKLLMNYDINMQTVMIESNLIKKFNLNFNQELEFSPDYDLFMEIAVISNIVSLGEYLSKYRLHCDSLTQKSQHLICKEGVYTLNRLSDKYSYIADKYKLSIKFSESTFKIQEAIFFLREGDFLKSQRALSNCWFINPKAFILLILILFRISPNSILKIIGRGK